MLYLKEVRKRLKVSQTKLAELLGVAQETVSKWERGLNSPSIETLDRIAEVLGIPVQMLLGVDLEKLPDKSESKHSKRAARDVALQPSASDLHVALHLPEGISYGLSEEGKEELYKYIQYLLVRYPAEPESDEK